MSSPLPDESKTAAVGVQLTKTQEQYLRARAASKGVGLSDYIWMLIARALRSELAEQKTTGNDVFIDSLLE